MLNGATRAAKKVGALTPERVWVVVVPVVVILVLDRLAQFVLVYHGTSPYGVNGMWLLSGAGPILLRDAFVLLGWALTAYTGVWAFSAVQAYAGEVRRLGRRLRLPFRSFGRLLLFGGLFLAATYGALQAMAIPTAEDAMTEVRLRVSSGRFDLYSDAVQFGVPGIRTVCLELRADPGDPQRAMGAAGLWYLGDRSEETLAVLDEYPVDDGRIPIRCRLPYARLRGLLIQVHR